MKTIEERGKEYVLKAINSIELPARGWGVSANKLWRAYIEGATEQKAIDEAKLLKLKSAWEKEAQINHDDEANRKQGYHDAIEQACELLDTYLMEIADLCDWRAKLLLSRVTKKLRIAMEKKL